MKAFFARLKDMYYAARDLRFAIWDLELKQELPTTVEIKDSYTASEVVDHLSAGDYMFYERSRGQEYVAVTYNPRRFVVIKECEGPVTKADIENIIKQLRNVEVN